MKKLSSLAAVCGGLLFASVCVGLMTAPATLAQGGTSGKDVRVVNTAAEAVPVNVTQLPAVQVGNGAGNPVPVNVTNLPAVQSAGTPVQVTGEQMDTDNGSASRVLYTVPAGKRLVIGFMTIQCSFSSSDAGRLFAIRIVEADGTFTFFTFLPEQQINRNPGFFLEALSEQVQIFAGAGARVEAIASGSFSETFSARVSFSGYLFDAL
jgi:hypothetical protein